MAKKIILVLLGLLDGFLGGALFAAVNPLGRDRTAFDGLSALGEAGFIGFAIGGALAWLLATKASARSQQKAIVVGIILLVAAIAWLVARAMTR